MNSINTPLLSQFQPYTDQWGMITNNNQGNPTGNGNLFMAHYVYGLVSTNQINDQEKQRIIKVYTNNFSQSGLLCRTPNFPGDRQAQDDLYGLMGAEALLCPKNRAMTKAIYNYGKQSASKEIDSNEPDQSTQKRIFWTIKLLTFGRCRWVWNNVEPGKFDDISWLGRFPAFLAVMQMSLRGFVNPFNWLYWCVTSLNSAWYGDASDNNGDCLMLQGAIAAQGYGSMTNWVCKQIFNGTKRKYGSAGGLMQAYFADPNHPLVNLLKDLP